MRAPAFLSVMLFIMAAVLVVPDFFHHVPAQHAIHAEAGSSDATNQTSHSPLPCSLLHAGHLCHVFGSASAIVFPLLASTGPNSMVQRSWLTHIFPSGTFHPPRS